MLADLFLQITLWFARLILWILPSWSLPTNIVSSMNTITDVIVAIDYFFPVHALIYGLGVIFAFEILIWTSRLLIGFIAFVRGFGEPDI